MFGKLTGKIDTIFEDKLILDVNGVGYEVYVSAKTLENLRAKIGSVISLIIETIVREDHIHLYGFTSAIEKTWFNELCKVSGVGSKMGLKILSGMSIDEILTALSSGDQTLFSKTPGIGPKLAQRIVTELKGSPTKIGGEFVISSGKITKTIPENINSQILADAVSALENLGYKRADAYTIASKKIAVDEKITLESLITFCLRELGRK